MSSLLPLKPTVTRDERDVDPRLVAFDDAEAEDILSAVSSTTARRILELVYDEPRPASELADELDTSVQNVSYHLERLENAGLLEVAEVWYSEQGREMDVYAPDNSALVLYAGAEEQRTSLSDALHRVLGAVGVVGIASALVHTYAGSQFGTESGPGTETTDVGTYTTQQPEASDPTLWETVVSFATGPGGAVFAIGLVTITLAFAAWFWWSYRAAGRPRTA
jgi:DNA-binding transcriptional ArsR family regulator